jgi:molecular chaperone DnaK
MTADLVERCRVAFEQALKDAGVKAADIDEVILVGGQTRMPRVQAAVEKLFGKTPRKDVNPDEAVAYGAACYAGFLTGDKDEKISQLDVIKAEPTIGPKETSRLNDDVKLTTDESLLEISIIKNRINSQILKAVKETAIDCRLYEKAHAGEGLKCYDGFGIVKSNNFGSFPTIQQDVG